MCVTGIHVSCFLLLLLLFLLLLLLLLSLQWATPLSAVHLIHLRVGHTHCLTHGDHVRKSK